MPFAQLVIGPPGSGKSTYCDGMHQLLTSLGRKCSVVNLDPANDNISYPAALDVCDLVPLGDIMELEGLGPNGAVLYALEELENNIQWLEQGLSQLGGQKRRLLDLRLSGASGTIYSPFFSARNILSPAEAWLVVMHLVDSHSLTLPTMYISMLLLSLRSMLQMDLPHLNVLTKIDNLVSYPPLPLPLSFYTEARSLEHILPFLEEEQPHGVSNQRESREYSDNVAHNKDRPNHAKFTALNEAIIELVDDYGLVGFETLAVEDRTSMLQLLRVIDRASGYAFGGAEGVNETIWQVAVREGGGGKMEVRDIEERWIDRRVEFDEVERRMWAEEGELDRMHETDEGTDIKVMRNDENMR